LRLAEANYQRMPSEVSWVRDLVQTADIHYPVEPLAVGKPAACRKLREFLNECVRRGMVVVEEE
jgi:hypothetical protein